MFKVSAIIHSNEFDEFLNFTIGHNLVKGYGSKSRQKIRVDRARKLSNSSRLREGTS